MAKEIAKFKFTELKKEGGVTTVEADADIFHGLNYETRIKILLCVAYFLNLEDSDIMAAVFNKYMSID